MCQHAHCLISIRQSLSVGIDIHAIRQPTYYQYLWTELSQVSHETHDDILSISRTVTSAHDIDDPLLVEVSASLIEKYQGSVIHVTQSLWIIIIHQCQWADIML